MRGMILPLALMLHTCVPVSPSETASRGVIVDSTFPPMNEFGAPRPSRPVKSNNDLALDFIELPFRLESGRDLPVFKRFRQPIMVRITGAPPSSLGSDLTKMLDRMRTEANIKISQCTCKRNNPSGQPRRNSPRLATYSVFCCPKHLEYR
jgi:hypothetical protein